MPATYKLNPNGNIEVSFSGQATFEETRQIVERTHTVATELSEEKKPVLILADLTQAEPIIDPQAVRFTAMFMRDTKFTKVALFGLNRMLDEVIEIISKISGKGERIRGFETRAEAVKWLEEK